MKIKLTANWRTALKMWSIRLNALASIVVAYVLASPEVLLHTMNSLPPEMRSVFPPVAGMVLFALVYVVRLAKQKKLSDDQ